MAPRLVQTPGPPLGPLAKLPCMTADAQPMPPALLAIEPTTWEWLVIIGFPVGRVMALHILFTFIMVILKPYIGDSVLYILAVESVVYCYYALCVHEQADVDYNKLLLSHM